MHGIGDSEELPSSTALKNTLELQASKLKADKASIKLEQKKIINHLSNIYHQQLRFYNKLKLMSNENILI